MGAKYDDREPADKRAAGADGKADDGTGKKNSEGGEEIRGDKLEEYEKKLDGLKDEIKKLKKLKKRQEKISKLEREKIDVIREIERRKYDGKKSKRH